MKELRDLLEEYRTDLFDNLFEVRFVTTLSEQAVITLIYRRPLSASWLAAAEKASLKLNAKIVGS